MLINCKKKINYNKILIILNALAIRVLVKLARGTCQLYVTESTAFKNLPYQFIIRFNNGLVFLNNNHFLPFSVNNLL